MISFSLTVGENVAAEKSSILRAYFLPGQTLIFLEYVKCLCFKFFF